MKITGIEKLATILSKGESYTVRQLERQTGLANVRAAVDRLRKEGWDIAGNARVVNGQRKFYYQNV